MIWGTYYHKFGQNIKIFKILCTKYMASSDAMTSSTRSFAYSYRLVKKCFVKTCVISKCHNFLQPNVIRFSLFCSKIFTLSSEIKLNLFWSSPLTLIVYHWSNCRRSKCCTFKKGARFKNWLPLKYYFMTKNFSKKRNVGSILKK